jgi:diguanylate cyclase (GGDEF)-like protein
VPTDHRDKPIVLVMDDAPEHREYAKRLLESEGYPVSLASTIAGALKTIHGGQELMIAFIDIHMHSGSLAHEVFGYIKRTASHRVVCYAWTGDTRQETHLAAVKAGAFRVFNKGVDTDDLILEYMKSDVELIRAHGEDDLTGLFNARSFRRSALEDLKTMRDHGHPHMAALMFIDIDDFKQFNDNHGHLIGDEVIKVVGGAARGHVRPGDHLCRKGGDELLVFMPGLGGAQAIRRALLIQRTVAGLSVSGRDGQPVPISVSVGVAEVHGKALGEDLMAELERLIARADEGKMADKLTKAARRTASSGVTIPENLP